MNAHDYRFLLAERSNLTNLIADISELDIISRMSLQARLQEVEAQLGSFEGMSPRIRSARLTFRGQPVLGRRGILMDFGTEAAQAFATAVTVTGSSLMSTLAPTGKVPHAQDFRLAITGIAYGSFGFEIEEASPQMAFDETLTPVEVAIDRVKNILAASLGSDEELSDAISETDRRALSAVQNFLKTVADGGAAFTLSRGGEAFEFRDANQVRRSENRLSNDNIREEDSTISARFLGYFPHRPRAQFLIIGTDTDSLSDLVGDIVSGPVEQTVAEDVNINGMLNRDVWINVHTRRVGSSRPRFRVTGILRDAAQQLSFDEPGTIDPS